MISKSNFFVEAQAVDCVIITEYNPLSVTIKVFEAALAIMLLFKYQLNVGLTASVVTKIDLLSPSLIVVLLSTFNELLKRTVSI